jgi:hypothetical protein
MKTLIALVLLFSPVAWAADYETPRNDLAGLTMTVRDSISLPVTFHNGVVVTNPTGIEQECQIKLDPGKIKYARDYEQAAAKGFKGVTFTILAASHMVDNDPLFGFLYADLSPAWAYLWCSSANIIGHPDFFTTWTLPEIQRAFGSAISWGGQAMNEPVLDPEIASIRHVFSQGTPVTPADLKVGQMWGCSVYGDRSPGLPSRTKSLDAGRFISSGNNVKWEWIPQYCRVNSGHCDDSVYELQSSGFLTADFTFKHGNGAYGAHHEIRRSDGGSLIVEISSDGANLSDPVDRAIAKVGYYANSYLQCSPYEAFH